MLEENNIRIELGKRIVSLQEKLSRVTIDQHYGIEKEIKTLQEEYLALPPETIEAGTLYLDTKVSYENGKHKVIKFKGKLYFYDGDECISSQVEVDDKGKPIRAIVPRRNSETNGSIKHFIYNLKIDQEEPQEPRGIPYKLKLQSTNWDCPICNVTNPVEYEYCYNCKTLPPKAKETLAIKA